MCNLYVLVHVAVSSCLLSVIVGLPITKVQLHIAIVFHHVCGLNHSAAVLAVITGSLVAVHVTFSHYRV